MSIESQFEEFRPDPVQDFDVDMTTEERSFAIVSIQRTVEDICINRELANAITAVLEAVTRTYEPELRDPRFNLTPHERNDRDQHTRGIIMGLARANEYITNPRYAGELLKLLNPNTDQED